MSTNDESVQFLKRLLRKNDLLFKVAQTLYRAFHVLAHSLTSTLFRRFGLRRFLGSNPNRITVREIGELDTLLKKIEADCGFQMDQLSSRLESITLELKEAQNLAKMDPFGEPYLAEVMRMHRLISGKTYDVNQEGLDQKNIQERVRWQTPYGQPPAIVGAYLIGFGFLIQKMNLPLGSRILEIGCGEGSLSIHFAKMGYHLTCVEVSPSFAEITRLALTPFMGPAQRIEVIQEDIFQLDLQKLGGQFDAIVFYESFHHIPQHFQLLKKLKTVLAPHGVLVLGAEPIYWGQNDSLPYPWGLNLSGEGLRTIRKFGWMELGFTNRYIYEMLNRLDLRMQRHKSFDSKWSDLILAYKK